MYEDIYINDVAGSTLGVVLVTPPPIVSAAQRGEWVELPGLDGEVWREDGGLADSEVEMELYAWESADMSAVLAWIRGMTRLRWGQNAWFYRARVRDAELLAENWEEFIDCGRTIHVTVRVKPYRYRYPEAAVIVAVSGGTISNPGTAPAAPIIEVTGSEGRLSIGDYRVEIGATDGLVIDCEAKRLTDLNGALASIYVSMADTDAGRWPRLNPGANTITWTGGITGVTVTPRWRDR